MSEVYKLTKEIVAQYRAELDSLLSTGRKEIAERINEARQMGDLSENAEYDAAKTDQGKMEARIIQLEHILANCTIIDEAALTTDVVKVGLSVKIHDKAYNEDVVYTIVNAPQVDPFENKISDESPLGVALVGHSVGETVTVESRAGVDEITILEIFKQ